MGKDCCKMHQIFGLTCKQMVLIGMVELLHWTSSHGFHMFISLSELLAFRTRFFFFFNKCGLPCDQIDLSESPTKVFVHSSDPHACLMLHPFYGSVGFTSKAYANCDIFIYTSPVSTLSYNVGNLIQALNTWTST